ncbi:hypothetical protein VP01_4035g3 [Puccinia sorghi]|uniref:adenosylmethionine decarboxylase n=1 Tax=Puccinia sorghi TaxID=27349 RepID=A0A0L6URT9_9BASI|nr:hypothetical protein VP01_4035g3 [Puccinia sorghi]
MQVEAERTEQATYVAGAFEGPEKLLELWFAPNAELVPARPDTPASSSDSRGTLTGLRAVDHSHWHLMLDQVKCKVLSIIQADHVDAFLLSESSMFVWPHKIILKTCGTTGLLLGLDTLLQIAKEQCGFNGAWRWFYSRKAFMFPAQQSAPHTSWEDETRFLDKRFAPHATAQVLGENPWYLYHRTAPTRKTEATAAEEDQDTQSLNGASQEVIELAHMAERDYTLEILMTGLGRGAARQFEASEELGEGHEAGMKIARRLSLDAASLLGRGSTDAYLFSPCGFSANLVGGPDDSRYGTIHVTPEASHSFASFETNLDYTHRHHDLRKLIQHFLDTFQPQNTTITLFNSHVPHPANEASSHSDLDHKLALLLQNDLRPSYSLVEHNDHELDDYNLAYISLERVQEDTSTQST